MAFCPYCAAPLNDNQKFCPNCGKPNILLSSQTPSQPLSSPQVYQPVMNEKSKSGKTKVIILTLIIAVLVAVAVFSGIKLMNNKGVGDSETAPVAQSTTEEKTESEERSETEKQSVPFTLGNRTPDYYENEWIGLRIKLKGNWAEADSTFYQAIEEGDLKDLVCFYRNEPDPESGIRTENLIMWIIDMESQNFRHETDLIDLLVERDSDNDTGFYDDVEVSSLSHLDILDREYSFRDITFYREGSVRYLSILATRIDDKIFCIYSEGDSLEDTHSLFGFVEPY